MDLYATYYIVNPREEVGYMDLGDAWWYILETTKIKTLNEP